MNGKRKPSCHLLAQTTGNGYCRVCPHNRKHTKCFWGEKTTNNKLKTQTKFTTCNQMK